MTFLAFVNGSKKLVYESFKEKLIHIDNNNFKKYNRTINVSDRIDFFWLINYVFSKLAVSTEKRVDLNITAGWRRSAICRAIL